MTVGSMGVAVGNFFGFGGAHFGHFSFETYFHASQRMVAVHHGFAVGHIGHAVHQYIAGFGVDGYKHHAHLHFHRKHIHRLNAHQFGLLFAKRIVGLEQHIHLIARSFAL